MQIGGDKGMVLFCRREVWAVKVVMLGSVANCETMIQAIQDVLDESFVRMFGEQGAESTHSNWGEGREMGWGERSGRRARALRTVVRLGGPPQTVWSVGGGLRATGRGVTSSTAQTDVRADALTACAAAKVVIAANFAAVGNDLSWVAR